MSRKIFANFLFKNRTNLFKLSTTKKFLFGSSVASGVTFAALPFFDSKPDQNAPGDELNLKSKMGEYLAHAVQSHYPVNALHTHLVSLPMKTNDKNFQIEAHHYVSHLNEDIMQAIIFDSDRSDAKIIGVEYIITEKLFKQLPENERKYWSSRGYEVKSGILAAPGMPRMMEHKLMADMAPTYSKTWMTWQSKTNDLPFGDPELLCNPTRDGDIKKELLLERDRKLSLDFQDLIKNREDIPMPTKLPGSDSWMDISLKSKNSAYAPKEELKRSYQ